MADPFSGLGEEIKPDEFSGLGEAQEPTLVRLGKMFFGNFNEGLAVGLGLPVDLVNFGLQKVGLGSDKPFFGSRQLTEFAGAVGLTAPEARTRLERMIGRVGLEVGAGAPFAALGLAGAGRAAQTARTTSRAVPTGRPVREGVRATLERMGRAPGGAAVGEGVAMTGAGTGAAVAQEVAPGSPGAEITGQLVGSVVPSLTPLGFLRRAGVGAVRKIRSAPRDIPALVPRFSPEARATATRAVIGETVEPIVREAGESVAQAQRIQKEIPGLDLSLAETTRSPSLIRTQEVLEGAASGTDLDKMIARRQKNLTAVDEFARKSAPEGVDNPQLVVDAANRRVLRTKERVGAAKARLGERRTQAGERVNALRIDRESTGQSIRNALNERMRERSAAMTKRAQDLGVNDINLEAVAGGELANETKQLAKLYRTFLGERLGPKTVFMAEKLGLMDIRKKGPITFGFLKTLRESVVRDYIAAASGQNVNRAEVALLGKIRTRVDDLIDSLGNEIGDPDLASRYSQFRKEYFDNFISVFDQGAALKARQLGAKGFFVTPDENVADAFFRPDKAMGSLAAARKFKEVFGNSMDSAMEEVILDKMSRAVIKEGQADPRLLRKFAADHKEVMAALGMDADGLIAEPLRVENEIAQRLGRLEARKRKVENSILARTIHNPSVPPEKIISDAVRDPRKMQSLLRSVQGVPEAQNALKRAVWAEASGIQDPRDMLDFIVANQKTLKMAFGNKHIDDLKKIQVARSIVNAVRAPAGQSVEPQSVLNQLREHTGFTADSLSNRILQVHLRQIGTKFFFANAISRFISRFTQRNFQESMREVLYNPALADEWAKLTRPGFILNVPKFQLPARRINSRLFNLGLTSRTEALQGKEGAESVSEGEKFQQNFEAAGAFP